MRNVLFIAQGQAAADVADRLLRDEHVLVTRVTTAEEANALATQPPFDAVVCALDDLKGPGRAVVEFLEYLSDVPTVIVLGNPLLPVQSLRINVSIVAIQDGIEPVRTAVKQQLRRIQPVTRPKTKPPELNFSFVIPARPDRIGRARTVAGSFVQRSLKLPDYELLKLELVIEEALANAVYHGSLEIDSEQRANPVLLSELVDERTVSQPFCDRKIRIDMAIDETQLQILIADEGPGFDFNATAMALENNDAMRPSGRGLLLMRAFADKLEFNEKGNEVRITRLRTSFNPRAETRAPVSVRGRIDTVPMGTSR